MYTMISWLLVRITCLLTYLLTYTTSLYEYIAHLGKRTCYMAQKAFLGWLGKVRK